jgi:hypothetical protein
MLVDEPVDAQRLAAGPQASCTIVRARDIPDLLDDVQPQSSPGAAPRGGLEQGRVVLRDVLDVPQPVVDQPVPVAVHRRLDAAAAQVAADDDLPHLQHVDGVLEDGQAVEVGVDDDVRDVAVHEHLARVVSVISFAGTRLSAQPIQSVCGACCAARRSKNPGSRASVRAAQSALPRRRSSSATG